jgi:hypothetical protein
MCRKPRLRSPDRRERRRAGPRTPGRALAADLAPIERDRQAQGTTLRPWERVPAGKRHGSAITRDLFLRPCKRWANARDCGPDVVPMLCPSTAQQARSRSGISSLPGPPASRRRTLPAPRQHQGDRADRSFCNVCETFGMGQGSVRMTPKDRLDFRQGPAPGTWRPRLQSTNAMVLG